MNLQRIRERLRKSFFSSRRQALKIMVSAGVLFWSIPMCLLAAWDMQNRASFSLERYIWGGLVVIVWGAVLGTCLWALACIRWSEHFRAHDNKTLPRE